MSAKLHEAVAKAVAEVNEHILKLETAALANRKGFFGSGGKEKLPGFIPQSAELGEAKWLQAQLAGSLARLKNLTSGW